MQFSKLNNKSNAPGENNFHMDLEKLLYEKNDDLNKENLKNEYKFEISRDSKKGSDIADLDQLTRYRKSWCNSMGSEIATSLGWKSGRKCR